MKTFALQETVNSMTSVVSRAAMTFSRKQMEFFGGVGWG